MAKVGVSLKINTSMIDMARLFQGQKGQYLDATVFIDLDKLDDYGNSGMITQDVSKEEKQQGVKGNILGNCKVFWSDSGQPPQGGPVAAPQGFVQNQGFAPQQPPQMAPQQPPAQNYAQQPQQPVQQQAPQQPQQGQPMEFVDDIPF